MPKIITSARELAYLRALAETGNATLAAQRAGVSRAWAYKKRAVDAGFDGWCRAMAAESRARLPVQVRRGRKGGWTAAKEARFLERLEETCSVPLACAEVGLSTVSAYRRRQVRRLGGSSHPSQPNERFAAAWAAAEREGWPPTDQPWIESAICFLEGRPQPADNAVRITSVREVLQALKSNLFVPRRPRK